VHLESGDVVRHRLVKAIINAYDKDDEMQAIRKHEREQERPDISNVENPEKS
jgi:phosphate starvation-inducible protein PhoH